MAKNPAFVSSGTETDKIDVRLSYRIVTLFSEGLYASPNKAIEELVANSFDAGAHRVAVLLPADFHEQGATIAVIDDGEGMDSSGLKQHWLIGKSLKRDLSNLPLGRQQIGKFGIGKLATYVLANRLTHISKKSGKYYSTSMDFKVVDDRGEVEIEPKTPVRIALRELSDKQVKEALKPWTENSNFKKSKLKLFGPDSPKSWTFAVLSDLKPKVHEIRRGRLKWVLRTALPLRDDFEINLDGTKLEPSKTERGRIKKWVIGKDIVELSKPAPKGIEVVEDKSQPANSETRYALQHGDVGRITGYAEVYRDLLTGKSDELGRSYGFFVYVRGRLINVEDGHFGIPPDELRHGTFGRMRIVVKMDGLDEHLQSDRERLRQGPVLTDAQNILRAIFNTIRPELEKADAEENPGAKLARKLADSPASLSRRPIIEMARAALDGKIRSRYISLPATSTKADRNKLVDRLEALAETPDQFVAGVEFVYDATSDDGIAVYDAETGKLRVNGLHPFVGAFYDEFTSKNGLPLEMFAMAEVLLESFLFQAGVKQGHLEDLMNARDQLLRHLAKESGRRTALAIANALRNARNDEDALEVEVVESFRSLGFDATRIGGNGKPDGVAKAHLSPDDKGKARRYALTLDAKSKKKDGAKLSAKSFGVAAIARHRDDYQCEHALVVAPAFEQAAGKESALSKEIKKDREMTATAGKPRTITAIHIDDLARLVQLRPVKRLTLARFREMLETCSLPEHCKAWVDRLASEPIVKPPYEKIIVAIHEQQQEYSMAAVEYGALRVALGKATPPYRIATNDELMELCKAMAAMVSGYEITATDRTVELNQSPENVLAAIEAATKEHLGEND